MVFDFAKAVAHAGDFWFKPCEDHGVVTRAKFLDVRVEMRKRGLSEKDFEAGYFNYQTSGSTRAEGLFFISKSFSPSVDQRVTADFSIDSVPDPRHFVCSFRDSGKDVAIGQTPEFTGLNDCTHFVSECLSKAGIKNIKTNDPGIMFERLKNMGSQTKTLALMVDIASAKRIINKSGILQPGDVILYATPQRKHLHCGLILSEGQVAQHTHINHAKLKSDQTTDSGTGKKSNWEVSSNGTHPLVTIVHFTRSSDVPAGSIVPGWWKVTRGAKTSFSFFDKNGAVGTTGKPPNVSRPIAVADERGYWFQDGPVMTVCWSKKGDTERYSPVAANRMPGKFNDGDQLVAEKLK